MQPVLRRDLVFTPCSGATPHYLIEDPARGKFFRIGQAEYTLISLLDGQHSVETLLRTGAAKLGAEAFTEAEIVGILHWLTKTGLLESRRQRDTDASKSSSLASASNASRSARFNPLIFRVPIWNPQKWFAHWTRAMGWIFESWCGSMWAATVLFAALTVLANRSKLLASSDGIFSLDRSLWLAACWLALKFVHETAHGIACVRYGGTVQQAGVVFVLGAPMPYVDVTSSWRFRSQWHRMIVAAAGMYAELFVAALAALVWSWTRTGWLNDLCFNLLLMASLTTVLFNANPLMRFDGYYILSDLLGLPNLATQGRAAAIAWMQRWFLGQRPRATHGSPARQHLLAAYGLAAAAWSGVATIGLLVSASQMFAGAGIVLALMGIILWWVIPVARAAVEVWRQGLLFDRRRQRQALRPATISLATALLMLLLPAPWFQRTPAVVDYAPQIILRAQIGRAHV